MFDYNSVGLYDGQRIEPMGRRAKVGELHVLSGSFNPLHDGHRWMFESIDEEGMVVQHYGAVGYAVAATTSAKYFEISTQRIGKENLSQEEMLTRLRQFSGYAPVLVLERGLFIDKLDALHPYADHITFHIGYDNYLRLLEYNGAKFIAQMRCSFCVWPRDGQRFVTGPANCFDSGLDQPEHLVNISSTLIRSKLDAR